MPVVVLFDRSFETFAQRIVRNVFQYRQRVFYPDQAVYLVQRRQSALRICFVQQLADRSLAVGQRGVQILYVFSAW
jgi:hypothetical protein